MKPRLYERTINGGARQWTRTRIRDLPLTDGEAFLEAAIAEHPELLGFGDDDDVSGVHGPFVPLRQVELTSLNGRSIYPDLVVLCGSGDIVIVEVKLGDNPEVRDRRVVAQVLEYAAGLAKADEADLVRMFDENGADPRTWRGLVEAMFHGTLDHPWLANQLLDRLKTQRLHLVIACDEVPQGVRELVEGVVGQHAIGEYQFRVVEIATYASDDRSQVMFLPDVRIQTEIVSRTAVSVELRGATEAPNITVAVTPFSEAKTAEQEAARRGVAKVWDEESFFAAASELSAANVPALRAAYDHFRSHGYGITFGRGAKSGTIRVGAAGQDVVWLFTNGNFLVSFNYVTTATADGMRRILRTAGIDLPECSTKSIGPDVWVPRCPALLAACDRWLEELEELRG